MSSGNWQAAWRIYNGARELPSDQQRAFVESESADPGLARHVFELLASLAEEESQQPEVSRSDRAGTHVGRYQVGNLLGRGGVGEVYAARDTDLDRPVALKFLRAEGIGDTAAVKRFIREAKAASALNHPNILTIYEVIDSSADLAIAMELVEGDNLSSVRGLPQPAERLIRIGQQIAHALGAAHQAGLIHRDIKPENILVRKDGYVKIVDFGLARRVALSDQGPQPAVHLVQQQSTLEGKDLRTLDTVATGISGTLRYMSPEQTRGEEIAPASDIFSFGLVLYEIATGQHAFPGDSPLATMEAILTGVPAPPSSYNAAISAELDRLILRMLAKDAQARPGAEQIAVILGDLERARGVPALSTGAGLWTKAGVWAVAGVLAAGIFAVWRWPGAARPAKVPTFRQVTTLVAENRATAAAISPDGRWTAYANTDGIFVQPTESNLPKPLRAPANFITDQLAWSADGTKLLASGFSSADNTPEVWMISATGDAPGLLRARASGAAFSPDGTRIAFINEDRSEIWTIGADGAGARKVLGGQEELFLSVFWSPDGRRLSYQRRRLWAETGIPNPATDIVHASRYESAEASTGRVLAQVPGIPITTAAPLSDGRLLFITAGNPSGDKGGFANAGGIVWEVRTDAMTGAFAEQPRTITRVDTKDTRFQSLSATADGRRIMVIKRTDQTSVFVGNFDQAPPRLSKVRRIIFDEQTDFPHAWTADSRALIFESNRNGQYDLFRQYLDRRTPETIMATPKAAPGFPQPWVGLAQLAGDGRTVLFALQPDPKKQLEFRLMRVPLEGGTPEFVPIGGPEGEMLDEFRCAVGGKRCVLRTAVLTGNAGQYFAFHELDPVRGKGPELARTAWSRNILGDWDLSADGMQVAIPNHYSRDATIRLVSMEPKLNQPRERELRLSGLSDLKGVVAAADGSGWFVTSDTDIGVQMFFVFPDGRFHLLGDISGWAIPAPDRRHVAFVNRLTASNAWVLDR